MFQGLELMVHGLGFRVDDLGFKIDVLSLDLEDAFSQLKAYLTTTNIGKNRRVRHFVSFYRGLFPCS